MLVVEIAKHEGLRADNGAVETAPELSSKDRIAFAQRNKIAVHCVDFGVTLAFAEVEPATLERRRIGRIGEYRLRFRQGQLRELGEAIASSFRNQPGQLRVMIGEKQKGTCGGELLTLEKHRRARGEQQQS